MGARLFLLSPASCSGNRARLLLRQSSAIPLAQQICMPGGAPLGEVFSFISQLYFRGKLAYARAFARLPRPGQLAELDLGDGVFVITTSRGLLPWQALVTVDTLREFASVAMGADAYRRPLEAGAGLIGAHLGDEDEVVLLGSIATDKYVDVLRATLGARLRFPREFVGRGDMSRGGLLLRCAREGRELDYIPVIGSVRHGARPPKLGPP
jgi:hypothetical protein